MEKYLCMKTVIIIEAVEIHVSIVVSTIRAVSEVTMVSVSTFV